MFPKFKVGFVFDRKDKYTPFHYLAFWLYIKNINEPYFHYHKRLFHIKWGKKIEEIQKGGLNEPTEGKRDKI